MSIFGNTSKGLGNLFNGAAKHGYDESQTVIAQEQSINALRKAMAAVQGREVSDMPSAAALRKNSAPISVKLRREMAEQERLETERRQEAERSVVIDCTEVDSAELFFKNGEKGPLLQAFEDDKIVILKRFQDRTLGADGSLHIFFAFISGEVNEYEFYDRMSSALEVRYKKEDIKPNFKIIIPLTGKIDSGRSLYARANGTRIVLKPRS